MNPQDNNSGEQGDNSPNFDGFGGPNISYENYKEEAPAQAAPAPVQPAINVVNANASGVISGRKMVDYIWQRIAFCGLAFSAVFLAGLIFAVILVGQANTERVKMETEKNSISHNIQGLYSILGVSSQEDAIKTLSTEKELLNGGDLVKIDNLLVSKYGVGYAIDFASSDLNLVKINNSFKVVSLGLSRPTGTIRIILYGRVANGEWKMGGFDSTNTVDPCANSSDEEKEAIAGIFQCGEPIDDGGNEEPVEPEKPDDGGKDDDSKKDEDKKDDDKKDEDKKDDDEKDKTGE